MMPPTWPEKTAERLRKLTKREIRVRPHPGNSPAKKPLAEDLAGAHACIIWSSSAGVHALVAGVPVICEAPYWICKESQVANMYMVDAMYRAPDRLVGHAIYNALREKAMHRLAWGQWHISEIESGEAFQALRYNVYFRRGVKLYQQGGGFVPSPATEG